jgi:hypothetical protein
MYVNEESSRRHLSNAKYHSAKSIKYVPVSSRSVSYASSSDGAGSLTPRDDIESHGKEDSLTSRVVIAFLLSLYCSDF